jgi:flavodoxin
MKKLLVLYYSQSGNSKFIAEKISQELGCDLKKITPIVNNVAWLFILSMLKVSVPIDVSTKEIEKYDEIIIIGPIWGGIVISPLRTMLKKTIKCQKIIHFAVSCETKDENKNDRYGYAQVLKDAEDMGGGLIKNTEAFSASLVEIDNKPRIQKLTEKIKITEDNYGSALKSKVVNFAKKIKLR